MVRITAPAGRHRLGRRARRGGRSVLNGKTRLRARVAECCRTKRSSCSSELVKKTGGAGAFRVRAGRGGAARRREGPRRCAPIARRTCARRRAVRLHAQRHAARRRCGAGDVLIVADEELAGVDAPDAREGERGHRHRHDAARVGAPRGRDRASRSRTWPKKTARSPICAAACSASCRRRRRRDSRGRVWYVLSRTCSPSLGEQGGLLRGERGLRRDGRGARRSSPA